MTEGEVERGGVRLRLLAFSVLVLLGVNGFFAFSLWVSWRDRLDSAEQETRTLAQSLADHAERAIGSADQMLLGVVETIQERMASGRQVADDPRLPVLLLRRASMIPFIRSLTLLNGDGLVIGDTGARQTNFADRSNLADFIFHRDQDRSQLYIDAPRVDGERGTWQFSLSRRIVNRQGRFAGVVVAMADPTTFRRYDVTVGIDSSGFAALMDRDGMVFSREPGFAEAIGHHQHDLPSLATLLATSPTGTDEHTGIDGIRRIISYQGVSGTPLVAMAALSVEHVLAPWRRELYGQSVAALLANVAVVAFAFALMSQVRRLEKAARTIRASETKAINARRQLADAIESMSEGFALFDRDERVVLFNHRYRKLLKRMTSNLEPGLPYRTLLAEAADSGFVKAARANPQAWIEARLEQHRHPTDEAIEQELSTGEWVLTRAFPTTDGGRVHIRTDITYLKRQQMEAAHQALLLRTTVENIVQGLCVFDADRRLLLWNNNWLTLLALPSEFGRVGTPLEEILRWRAARGDYGPGEIADLVAQHPSTLPGLDDHAGERVLPNGTVVDMLGVAMPDGGLLTTYTDVTVRRNAELALRQKTDVLEATLQSVDQGISMFDSQLRLIAANHRYYHLLDIPEADFPLGTSFEAFLYHVATRGEFGPGPPEDQVAERIQLARKGQAYLFERTRLDGTVVEARRTPTAQGGFVTTYADITERKTRENELKAAKAAAERTSEVRSLFLAKMSHELRTPFNAIIGFAEIIANKASGEDRHAVEIYAGHAEEIRKSGQHMLDLVNNILDLSKIEAGRMAVMIDRFDLRQILHSSLSMMRELSRSHGVTITLSIPPTFPETRADERAVKQIVTNLLSNALKFTPENGSIALSACPTECGGFEIAVSDTGIGIPSDQIDRVLLPFEQMDNRYSRSTGGTGLGLSLVKGLVELHGGSLRVESTVGHGTTVTATFPAYPPDAEGLESMAEKGPRILPIRPDADNNQPNQAA